MVKKPSDIVDEGDTERALRTDVLSDAESRNYPARLDWLAGYVVREGEYTLSPKGQIDEFLSEVNLASEIEAPYVEGLRQLVSHSESVTELTDAVRVGRVVQMYTDLVTGLENVDTDIPPGEVLGRVLVRELQRESETIARAAAGFNTEARTPRELLQQLATSREAAVAVRRLIEEMDESGALPERLGRVQLATRMWDHQREAFAMWLDADGEGYVDMATATGKTVLGLAAVGYCTASGKLHPHDRDWLADRFDGDLPTVANHRADDVLIVTTDDLLGAQWSRLFEQHCHTPPEYTQVVDGSISLPWGDVEIRAANALSELDPTDYRLAVFDEVHNYSRSGGWGEQLRRFVISSCPVLALTGSDTPALSTLTAETEFREVFEYSHDEALRDGVIPEFDWTLSFVPVDEEASSTLENLRGTTTLFNHVVDASPGEMSIAESVREDLSDEIAEALSSSFDSLQAVASGLRNAGTDGRAPTGELERLASGLAGRQTHWWNLRPEFDAVEGRVAKAIANERPTLVLTQSYGEASAVAERLDDTGAERIDCLERDRDTEQQADLIEAFDAVDESKKLLVGPGSRIGTGIDIRSVEVGINLARPGTGVNASLVQRLGRLLRRTDGDGAVEFYHVLGLPPTAATIPIDGQDFVDDVTEFFSQVELPTTDGTSKRPAVSVAEEARDTVVELERDGAAWHDAPDDEVTAAYIDQIEATDSGAAITTDWYPAASRWGAGVDRGTVAGTVVTDSGARADGPATLIVVPPADVESATVTLGSHETRGVCLVDGGNHAEFDGLVPGDYRIVLSADGDVRYRDVSVDFDPEPIQFDGGGS